MGVLVIATIFLYKILDREKLTLTLGTTISLSVFGLVLAWINRDKDAVKKSIDEKVPRKEFEAAMDAVEKRHDDFMKTLCETNAMTREIINILNNNKKR
jgi:low affinity Fe/Cu permease